MQIETPRNLPDDVVRALRQLREALQISEAIIAFLESPPCVRSAAQYAEQAHSLICGMRGRGELPRIESVLSEPTNSMAARVLAAASEFIPDSQIGAFVADAVGNDFWGGMDSWLEQRRSILPPRTTEAIFLKRESECDRLDELICQYCRQDVARQIVATAAPVRKKRRADDSRALDSLYLQIQIQCNGSELIYRWCPWNFMLAVLCEELSSALSDFETKGLAAVSQDIPPRFVGKWQSVLACLRLDHWNLWSQHHLVGGFSDEYDSDQSRTALIAIGCDQNMQGRHKTLQTLLREQNPNERVEWLFRQREKARLLRETSEEGFAMMLDAIGVNGGDVQLDRAN